MSVLLYRWGKFAFRRKWIVLPIWLALLIAVGGVAAVISKPMNDDFSMPNLPSERATEILDQHFPGMSAQFSMDAVLGTYVIQAPEGQKLTDPANETAIDGLIAKLRELPIVDADNKNKPLVNPVTLAKNLPLGPEKTFDCVAVDRQSPDAKSYCASAPLNVLGEQPDTVATLDVPFKIASISDVTPEQRKLAYNAADSARAAGLTVEMSGSLPLEQEQPSGSSEAIGFAVAFIVMIIAFGALIAAFVPLITAIVGLGLAVSTITMGTAFLTIPTFTPILATMIGIALSIDYALFIVSRYKHELVVQDSPEEAAGIALGTAGSAVVFAGLTVIIALAGLSIVGVQFLTFMGLGGAFAAAFAVLTAVTFLPALMGAFGRFLFKPKVPFVAKHDPEDDTSVTNGTRFARLIGKMPAVTFILSILVLGALAAPAAGMNLGLPGEGSMSKETTVRKAYDIRTEGFGEGSNGVLNIAVDLSGVSEQKRDDALTALREKIASYPDMAYVTATMPSPDGAGAMFNGVPKSGPNEQVTKDLVKQARDAEGYFQAEYGMEYGVTGVTAIFADVDNVLLGKIVPYLAIVAGAAFVLLILVFRSILVPLTAALGFLLSMAATFGATVLIFQEGAFGLIADPQPIISFLPIMLIGLVFGLAMDYQVFLVTRMREEFVHGKSAKDAMINGYHHGARVVTAAAIIMISVFSGFMLMPDATAKSMGFALAAGVLFDAFIVRMVLIPSLLVLMGKWSWWIPKWLDRILPDIDVEGAKLQGVQPQTVELKKEPVGVS
ncbi:MMPL family transporter [Nocardia sp. NPDC127579]|uniref:MMPL family transporter n=1 Tax=Nocardia sp. NPDC127579 TaxID=3345402 RepID=UPI003640997E